MSAPGSAGVGIRCTTSCSSVEALTRTSRSGADVPQGIEGRSYRDGDRGLYDRDRVPHLSVFRIHVQERCPLEPGGGDPHRRLVGDHRSGRVRMQRGPARSRDVDPLSFGAVCRVQLDEEGPRRPLGLVALKQDDRRGDDRRDENGTQHHPSSRPARSRSDLGTPRRGLFRSRSVSRPAHHRPRSRGTDGPRLRSP